VISATRELFSEDERVEFWPWIVEGTKLPPSKESLIPAGMEMRRLAGGIENSPKAHTFVDSENYQDFEHFVRQESCQGVGVWKAYSDIDVRR
jgi:hypothetical protein